MYSLETNTSTYIIPLDHIDLKTVHNKWERDGTRTKPLWNGPRNDKEYYRFELIARNTEFECTTKADDYSTATCYICNIKVPSLYIKAHNNSKKHKLCLEIADTALQRVKDQMSIDDTQSSDKESVDGYFCEPCSIIVTNDRHESTELHKSSVLHDKLLKYLLMIYSDKDNINKIDLKLPDCDNQVLETNEEIKYPTDNKVLDNADKKSKKRTRKRNKDRKDIKILDDSIDDDDDIVVDKDLIVVENIDHIVDNDPKSFKNYLKSLIEMFPVTPMEYIYIDENFIQINIDGHEKMLFVDNFLGIERDSNMCLMCSQQCLEEPLEDHLYDFDHMQKVMAPVKDQDCIRQINAATYYCILCACIITENNQTRNLNYSSHVLNRFHIINYKGALIKSNKVKKPMPSNDVDDNSDKMVVVKTNKTNNKRFCAVCKCNVDVDDLSRHNKAFTHLLMEKNCLNNSMSDTNDDMSQPDSDVSQSMHIDTENTLVTQILSDVSITECLKYQICATSNPKEVKCKVCDVIVPNTTTNIKDHTTGRSHKLKYNELLASNKIIRRVDNRYFCDFCEMQVPNKNELEHISGKNHQSKLPTDKEKKPGDVVVPNSIKDENQNNTEVVAPVKYENKTYCTTCAVFIDTHNFNGHVQGGKHKQMASASAKMDNVVQAFAQAAQLITEINNNLTNNDVTKQNKLKSNAPTTADNPIRAPVQMTAAQTSVNTETNGVQENFLYQMKATENIKSLLCKICKVYVPNIMKDVKIHVNGFNHQSNYNTLLTSNKLKKHGDKYICETCKVTVTRRNEIDHILGRNHQSNLMRVIQSDLV